jgi:serine/threonine protein phosphatase PrpC
MRLVAYGASDTGRIRAGNEDRFHAGTSLFAVADGLGGHAAGEVASALAIEAIAGLDGRSFPAPDQARQALVEAFAAAHRSVAGQAASEPAWRGMGTTLTALLVEGDRAHLAHVGDSRGYLLRGGGPLRQLTHDQTVAAELARSGRYQPELAASQPEWGALTQAIGLGRVVQVEVPEPLPLLAGDQVLLCTDGLTGVVDDDQIAELLTRRTQPEAACLALIDAANAAGGPDNITVVLLRADPSQPRRRDQS